MLDGARRRRAARLRVAVRHSSMHPALRWLADDGGRAHRRVDRDRTACGIAGQLRLATPGTALCATCYPPRADTGT